MAQEAEELIDYDEEAERSNIEYLSEFREKIFPVYQRQGFSFAEAYIASQLIKIENRIIELTNDDA